MKSRTGLATKEQILDVAERHFAAYGFAGASLRAIIKDAQVNVAAVAYHYGNKEDLFDAVVRRFAVPVVTEQLRVLDSMETATLTAVLEAFYLPPLKVIKSKGRGGQTLALFLGRMQTEPDPIFSMVDEHFRECRNRFVSAFSECMPAASESDLQWNFEFMLSLIVCFLTRHGEIRKRYAAAGDWTPEEAAARMIGFCQSGFLGRKSTE
jgi:AcrR family transcriptional regulator